MEGILFKTIFSQKLAGFLMQKGFVLMDLADSNDNSGRKVFYFKQSNVIEDAIKEYKQLRNK
jgi:hypothetical protein